MESVLNQKGPEGEFLRSSPPQLRNWYEVSLSSSRAESLPITQDIQQIPKFVTYYWQFLPLLFNDDTSFQCPKQG